MMFLLLLLHQNIFWVLIEISSNSKVNSASTSKICFGAKITKTSNSVFRENRCPHSPAPHTPPTTTFNFFSNRSRSPKSNQFFVMSRLYNHENLVRIQPQVTKILCRQECVTPTLICTNGMCTKINVPLPVGRGTYHILNYSFT